jgi:formamidopyrimidine-DNA glycosylase
MPELPEVETIRRGLDRLLRGKTVKAVRVIDSPKSFPNTDVDVSQFLIGATIAQVQRRAKVLLIELSSEYTLVTHLKMTGQLIYVGSVSARPATVFYESHVSGLTPGDGPSASEKRLRVAPSAIERWGGGHPDDAFISEMPGRFTRIELTFTDDSHLYFNDLRKFGWIKLYPTAEVPNIAFIQKLGPEPLEDSFTATEFIPRMRRRNNTTVKAAILDQTVLAGVGNIYADESLWGARIHPATRVRDVTDEQLAELFVEIKYVMNLSIDKGGSTDKNYVDAEGNKGSYLAFARVFRREGQPCPRHPNVLIEKIRVAGRGTHICPVCQVQ